MANTPLIDTLMSRKPLFGNGFIRTTLLDSFRKTFSRREDILAEAGGRAVGEMASVPIAEFVSGLVKRFRSA